LREKDLKSIFSAVAIKRGVKLLVYSALEIEIFVLR
jgi:hypothetical protein